MKKLLIGTSALVAAASFAGAAQAADPIKLSVGGYGAVMVGYASQDDDYLTATGREVTGVDVKGDNEIHFKGSTTLDNGLTVAVKYEMESGGRNSSADVSDEYSISISGGFGTIVAGADDNALVAIAKGAPRVGGRLFNGGFDEGDLITGGYVENAGTGAPNATFINSNGDSESLSYISPAIMGFTFGASYVPDINGDDNAAQPAQAIGAATTGSNEAYGAGLMWNGEIGAVSVGVEGGYLWADVGGNVTTNPATGVGVNNSFNGGREEWQAGTTVGYAGFKLGGAYRDIKVDRKATSGTSLAALDQRSEVNGSAWELGASYTTGPYGVSLSYFNSQMENTGLNTSDDTIEAWELAGQYAMGPGVSLVGGVGYVDFQNGQTKGTGNVITANSNQNSGWVVATGLSLSF
jgi:hypothetical protein